MIQKLLACIAIALLITAGCLAVWIFAIRTTAIVSLYATGNVKSVTPIDFRGRPHGVERDFFPDGEIQGEYTYDRGVVCAYVQFYPSGRIRCRMTEDASHGVGYEFFDDK